MERNLHENILNNTKSIFKNIISVLFPEQKTLLLLKNYFEKQEKTAYKNLAKTLSLKLQKQ